VGERVSTEHVTVVFTDLVGSTQLSSSVDPDTADRLRRAHFAALRPAIASSGGTEVKNLGDGLMVVFATASAALSCAVSMQQAVDRDNRGSEHRMGLRVGLTAGEATKEGDDYFGDPVIEAARLCARAEGGQILASELARATAGRRSPHQFRSVGALELKGLPEPVPTVEVAWDPIDDADLAARAVPLPPRLALRPGIGVVGRGPESDLLSEAFKRTSAGEGREVVLVSGEAGVGKTTLAADIVRTAYEAGACVLLGRCEEELGAPYQPFAEALGHLVTHGPVDLLRAHVEACGPELDRMVPALARRLGSLPASKSTDADTERYLLFGATVGLLAQVASVQPVVIVLDDLQWADKPSLQLLRHVVSNIDPTQRLVIMGIYRDSELSRSSPLVETLGALRREPGVSRIELKGLDDTGVVSFMEAAAGHRLDDAGVGLAHAVYRETDGNPFFVGEMLRHLSDAGAIAQDDSGRWTTKDDLVTLALPDSVREVIGARVARLGEMAKHVLSLASVIGRDFDLELLARVTERPEGELLDVLDAATATALVRELVDVPGRYSFTHALIQHTLYEDLGVTRRSRAHRSVAEALEAICGDVPGSRVGDLAYHWFSATQPVELEKALDYARQAAEAALAALAPDEALRYYTQALQLHGQSLHPDPLLAVDLSIGLGTAQRQAGVGAFRETLLEAAHHAYELGATDRLVAASLANSRGFFSTVGAADHERIALLELAKSAMGDDPTPERARILALLAQELVPTGGLVRRRQLSDEAVEIARGLGHRSALLDVLNLRSNALLGLNTLDERLRVTAEALQLAEELQDPVALYFAAIFRAFSALDAGNRDELDRAADLAIRLAEEVGQPTLRWVAMWQRVLRGWLDGELEAAEAHIAEAFAIGFESDQPDAPLVPGLQLSFLRWPQGRADEIEPMLTQFLADQIELPGLRAGLGMMHCENGQFGEARLVLDAELSTGFAHSKDDPYPLNTLVMWSHVISDLDHEGAAAMLLPDLLPHQDEIGAAGVLVSGAAMTATGQLLAVLGRHDAARDAFAHGVVVCERLGSPFPLALTHCAWARSLFSTGKPGDRSQAIVHTDAARKLAQAHGLGAIERRVERLLASVN
jgi:class 3 adenylate cyclase